MKKAKNLSVSLDTKALGFFRMAPSIRLLVSACMVLLPATLSQATTDTWTGGTSADWNTAGNWNSGVGPVPGSGDTALFNGGGGGHTAVTISANSSLNSLTFDTASAAAYTIGVIGGSTLTLSSGGTIQTTSTVANVETVNGPISLGGAYTFSSNAASSANTLNFGGTGTITKGTNLLTLAGSNTGANTISEVISGSGGLTKTGSGAWVLSGLNSYTGTTTINGGTLSLIGGTGTIVAADPMAFTGNGATFIYDNSASSSSKTQTIGAVTATVGDATIKNIANGATASTATITSTTRSTGATINFVTSGSGASFVSSATLAPGGANGDGIFYNGADYAVASAGGAIAAPVYSASGTTYRDTATNGNAINSASAGNWLVDSNSTVTGGNIGLGTIKFNGSYTLSTGGVFVGGVLDSGGQAAVLSSSIRAGTGFLANQDIVFRTDTATDTLTLSGGLSPGTAGVATGFTKTGAGTLIISSASSLTGNSFDNSGTVKVTNATGLGLGTGQALFSGGLVGTMTVNSGATLDLSTSTTMSVLKPIILSGAALTNSGAGATTLTTGVAGVQYTTSSGISTGGSNATVTISGGGGTGATATASLGLSLGSATISGGTGYVVGDVLTVTGGGGTGASYKVSSVSGGAITGVTLNASGSGFTGVPTGFTGGTGTGATLVGNNGAFVVASITPTATGSGYTSAPTVSIGSGSLSATAVIGSVVLNGTNNTVSGTGSLVLNTPISDGASAGGFTKMGTNTVVLAGPNTYSGGTTISAGVVRAGSSTALGAAAGSLTDNATFDLASNSVGVGAFNGTGTVLNSTTSSASTLTVGNGNTSGTFSGLIENNAGSGGTVALSKVGTGTQTLTTGNTYSGGTTVNAGELLLGNGVTGSATGSGALAVLSTGTLAGVGRSASGNNGFNIAGKVIAGNGTATDTTGVTTITGTSTLHNSTLANATLAFNLDTASTNASSINVGSTGVDFASTAFSLTLGAGTSIIAPNTPYILISGVNSGGLLGVDGSQYSGFTTDASGADGLLAGQYKILTGLTLSFTNDSGYYSSNSFLFLNTVGGVDNIEVEVVPEPSTWAMMLGGLALLLFRLRRKGQQVK